jgi:large subunit ribosomal protein L4e
VPESPTPTSPASPARSASGRGRSPLVGRHRVHVLSLEGEPRETVILPEIFSVPLRPDLIRRAVVAAQANRRQPYGPDPKAGLRHSVQWPGKGRGMARTPRLMNSNRGAQAPNTVGGREAHPPKPDAIYAKKINIKERRRALASALAATREVRLALERGHEIPDHLKLPLVLEDPLEEVTTAQRAREVLEALGIWSDVERASRGVHLRAGKGKMRGRVRRHPKSVLVVVSTSGRARGFRNFPGVDVVPVDSLGTEHLAPGGQPGRLTIYTPTVLKRLETWAGRETLIPTLPAPGSPVAVPAGGGP